jgi:hypothetical protein
LELSRLSLLTDWIGTIQRLLYVYCHEQNGLSRADLDDMTVMCGIQVKRYKLGLAAVPVSQRPKYQHLSYLRGKHEETYLYSNHTAMADGDGPDSCRMA